MKFFQKLENLFAATAFAEEGEFETAREMMSETGTETARKGVPAKAKAPERAPKRRRVRVSRRKAA